MSESGGIQFAKVSKDTLLITTWVLFGASAAFYISRLAIRVKFTGRLWIDDFLAGLALGLLLTHALLITIMADSMFESLKLASLTNRIGFGGKGLAKRENVFMTVSYFMKLQFAETIVFWSCLWMVKASFLAFFYRLTNKLRPYVIAWWCIVVFCALAYIASMITYPISCSSFKPLECETERSVNLSLMSLRLSTALDIFSDLMIIALPMSLAVRVRLPTKTKIALCGIFAIGGLVVLMAVVRIIITNNNMGRRPEVSWLNLWSAVESSTAVIVCNLAIFKFLFRGRASGYTAEYQYNRNYAVSGKPASEKMMTSQRSGTYPRNSTSVLQSGTRPSYPAKRGLQTHVTAIPLTERSRNGWEHGFGEIVVTRDIDQMTADDVSIYDDDMESPLQSRYQSKAHSTKSASAQHTPIISHQASFFDAGTGNSPSSVHSPARMGREERRKSDASNEILMQVGRSDGKFHFGTIR